LSGSFDSPGARLGENASQSAPTIRLALEERQFAADNAESQSLWKGATICLMLDQARAKSTGPGAHILVANIYE